MSDKPLVVVQAPFSTVSGYGEHSRDLIQSLIEIDKYDLKLIPTNWGNTPMNALDEHNPLHAKMLGLILNEKLNKQPDVFIQVTIPNEFSNPGKVNIGITAGIETTAVSPEWIEGCNRMDLVIVPSEHAKNSLVQTNYERRNKQTNQPEGVLSVTKPVVVLHEGVRTDLFHKIDDPAKLERSIADKIDEIPEDFCYLFVGHWLNGDLGHDRKDVGKLIQVFFETFKNMDDAPALILKTAHTGFSIKDRQKIKDKVEMLRNSVVADKHPNIYLVHGDLTYQELNSLYNHDKVKAMVSFTKGEGYGRPLAEFATTGKPIIVSGWSGHMDFINPVHHTLLPGEVKQIHRSAVWNTILIPESGWFYVDYQKASEILKDSHRKYKQYKYRALNSEKEINRLWSYEAMRDKFEKILDEHIKAPAKEMQLKLPKLKKVQ